MQCTAGRAFKAAPQAFDLAGEPRDRRRLEERAQRQRQPEGVAHQPDELRRQKRVSAQLEEVVLDPHLVQPQHV